MGRQPLVHRATRRPENNALRRRLHQKYNAAPDQFAAQAYDAVHIVAAALKKIKLSGNLRPIGRPARCPAGGANATGATGAFKFRQVDGKAGKPAGYDAVQAPIVRVTKGGKYVIRSHRERPRSPAPGIPSAVAAAIADTS